MGCGARGRVELSRTRPMPNMCVITGERATIEVGTKTDSIVTATWRDGVSISARATANGRPSPTNLVDLFVPQLEQFVRAIRHGEPAAVSGVEGRRSIDLLAACYAARERWTHPWDVTGDGIGASTPLEAEVA
jgi:predicted dehydrogenase